MEIKLSFLTGKIYVVGSMGKQDVTDDCINAVLIRLLEGHKDNIAVIKKSDGKKYELKAVEIEGEGIERIEAQSSVIIACQNAILQKDERIAELETERDKYNTIAANLQIKRQKAYDNIAELEAIIEKMKCCENCKSHTNVGSKCLLDIEDSLGCRANNYSNWKLKDNE